jgi:HEPN domain-containing protein
MQEQYQNIAIRSLETARINLESGIHEMAAFCCYHAYESSASALAASLNELHGKGITHGHKLNVFLKCVKKRTNVVGFRTKVSALNAKFLPLGGSKVPFRDRLLYPEQPTDNSEDVMIPENVITPEQVERLLQNVQEVVDWVGQQIQYQQTP